MICKFAVLLAAPATGVSVAVMPLAVLGHVPSELPVTSTVIVQPPAGRFGIVKFNSVAPAVMAGAFVTPTQLPPIVVEAMLMLLKVSVKLALPKALGLILPRENVSVLIPPGAIAVGAKALLIVGSAGKTRLALAADVLLPALVTNPPTGIALV